jgi:N-methylhydantoinase A
VNVRVVQSRRLPFADLADPHEEACAGGLLSSRLAYFEESGGYVETPVYRRSDLKQNDQILGPAIVEQADTTVVVYPGHSARVDSANNIIVTVPVAEAAPR